MVLPLGILGSTVDSDGTRVIQGFALPATFLQWAVAGHRRTNGVDH